MNLWNSFSRILLTVLCKPFLDLNNYCIKLLRIFAMLLLYILACKAHGHAGIPRDLSVSYTYPQLVWLSIWCLPSTYQLFFSSPVSAFSFQWHFWACLLYDTNRYCDFIYIIASNCNLRLKIAGLHDCVIELLNKILHVFYSAQGTKQ